MYPLSRALALLIDPYAGSSQPLPCIVELTQTPQVHVGEINIAEWGPTEILPPLSTRAPHGQIKRIKPTLNRPQAFKRLKIPLQMRRTTTTFISPPVNTIHPLFVKHIKIARNIGVTRYKLARTRPSRQVIDPILPEQGTILYMIWYWALSSFAPESLE